MNDILDIEIILKKQKYHAIYNIGTILLIITSLFLYISFTYKYKSYYITKGTMIDGNIKLLVKLDDIKYLSNNNKLEVDNALYNYQIEKISEELYIDESFNNYKEIYLKINGINNLNNYVYEIKIEKEYKKIIDYIIDYL
ncbi:MAG: hypothetical protein IJE89_04755 [Bacilli bacterium]|nr:hypothetical protein [Bacilli bacterium]